MLTDRSQRLFSRRLWCTGLLFLLLAACAPGLHAQFDSASVLGNIHDPSGAAIRNAHLTLTDTKKAISVEKFSDAEGHYEFQNVPSGNYRLSVTAEGFQPSQTAVFTVEIGARQRVDMSLPVGNAATSITVDGAATPLETETSDRGETVQGQQAVALPLNGRSYADLAILVPGVKKSTLESTSFPARDGSYNVNGLTSQANNFQLDGIDNNAYQEANQGYSNEAVIPSPDAVQEFKVETDNYSAEYGRAGGAIVNATTRGGGSELHGGVYDYLRNTVLNAYGPFLGLGVKPTLVQNQFGGMLGGPAWKDRLFYFGDYEGLRMVARTLTQAVLPTSAERNGIFTVDGSSNNSTGNIVTLKNPFTGTIYSDGKIPLGDSSINPLATKVFSLLPATNISGAALTSNNYQYMAPNTTTDDKGDGRLDFILSPRQNGFFRYSQRSVDYAVAPSYPGLAGGNSNGDLYARTRQIVAGWNWVISSNSILQLRFGQTWTSSGKRPVNLGRDNILADLGFANVPNDPSYTGGVNTQSVTGFTQFGEQATNPQFTNPTLANPKVNYSWMHGHHSIKLGYEYGWLSQAISDFHPKFGSDTYAGQFSNVAASNTSLSASVVRQAANLADFLWGARSHYELNNVAEVNYLRHWHMGYVQDDWRLSSTLTLNLGLRYEFVTPDYEQNNHNLNFDPVGQRILHAGKGTDVTNANYTLHYVGDGSLAKRTLVNPDYKDFGPRFGFAWMARPQTVVRGGYAISYAHLFRYGGEGLLAYNGPDVVDATIDQKPSTALCTSLTQDPSTCFRRTQDGYETNFASAINFSTTKAQTRYRPANFRTPYVQAYHLSVQQLLPQSMTLEVAYVGSHGVQLPALYDYNQARLCTAAEVAASSCPAQLARRSISGFTNILTESNLGYLLYHSLQVKLTRPFAHGLFLTNAFSWSKGINNVGADLETNGGDSAVVNIANVKGDRGLDSYNQPFNDTLSLIADLPFGRGQLFGKNAPTWQQQLLGGWQLTAVNVVTSGLPINVNYTANSSYVVSSTSSVYALRPNLNTSVKAAYGKHLVKTNTSVTGYLNYSSFSTPDGNVLFGNSPRNGFRGPAYGQLDLGLHKSLPLPLRHGKLEFRIEAFNALNATNYAVPDTAYSDGASSFGAFSNSLSNVYPSRQIQSALRLEF